jgi:hypothetical protein
MFKESLKNKAKNVFGGTVNFIKDIGGEFKNAMIGAFIDELTNRSPVLGAALAGSIKSKADKKHNERIKTSFTKLYATNAVNTAENPLASKVQTDLGKNATKEEVQKKIVDILTQLDKDVKIQSKSDLENNELYKRYSKEFQEYKKVINKQLAQKPATGKKQKAQSENNPAPVVQDNKEIVQKLANIDNNTQETNNRLSDLIDKVEKPSEQVPKAVKSTQEPTSEVSKVKSEPTSFDSVFKSLKDLVKIDSDVAKTTAELVEESKETNRILKENEVQRAKDEAESEENNQKVLAKKATQAPEEPNVEKQIEKQQPQRSLVQVLKDKSTDLMLNGGKAAGSLAIKGAKALGGLVMKAGGAVVESVKNTGVAGTIKEGLSKASEKVMGTAAKAKEAIANRAPAIKEGMKTATQKVMGIGTKAVEVAKSAGSTVAKTAGSLGTKAIAGAASMGSSLAGAASAALPAAGILAAGAAGYGLGTLINDKLLTNEDGSNKIGSWLFDKFGPEDPLKNDPTMAKNQPKASTTKSPQKQIVPTKNPVTAEVNKNIEQKEQNVAEKEQKSAQPIVINNSNNSSSSGGSSKGPSQFSNMITGISVRNSESTFERVQMQDFWPRTA